MATHSSVLVWRIPRTEEPGRLQSMESQRVRHNSSYLTSMHTPTISDYNMKPKNKPNQKLDSTKNQPWFGDMNTYTFLIFLIE